MKTQTIKTQTQEKLIKLFPHLKNESDIQDSYIQTLNEIQDIKDIQDFKFYKGKDYLGTMQLQTLEITVEPLTQDDIQKLETLFNSYLHEVINGYQIQSGVIFNRSPYSRIILDLPY